VRFEALWWLIRNLWFLRKLSSFPTIDHEGFEFRGVKPGDVLPISRVHALVRGRLLPWNRKIALFLVGNRMCLATFRKSDQKVIGFEIFYFNDADPAQKRIHEAYIAVIPEFRSRGLATRMRAIAANHFARAGIAKITTHVKQSNAHSLSSALNLGYVVSGEHVGSDGEVTHTLILDLNSG
jgi:ribosomal protein S18 acetylase RimI-like enzyme